jgi:hypothetical protein
MNVKLFKKLIKDAVTEAIHEELPDMIIEALQQQQKQMIKENKTFNFTSADVMPIQQDVKSSLRTKMSEAFGFQQPSLNKLEVIDAVDESTGEKINPFAAFIADAANNMTAQDRSGLRQLD